MKHICEQLLTKLLNHHFGFDAMVINSRGCANHTITSPQLYNGLWTNDVRYVINEIVSKGGPKRVFLMGFHWELLYLQII